MRHISRTIGVVGVALILLILGICIAATTDNDSEESNVVSEYNHQGHTYLLFHKNGFGYIGVVHSESCKANHTKGVTIENEPIRVY